jgi:HlyD family secretion protein
MSTPPRRWLALALLCACAAGAVAAAVMWRRAPADTSMLATVRRGTLIARLTASGNLKPIQSITYRSPVAGRDSEIVELVPEGTRVREGDLLVRLDATELERDVERARQEVRQARVDIVVAEIEKKEAEAAVKAVAEGEGALAVDEAKTRQQLAERKVARLRQERDQLEPLLEKGFITRDELKKTSDELEQAEDDLALAKRRADVVLGVSHPRDAQRAELQLAQKTSQLENVRTRAMEADKRRASLEAAVEACRVSAHRPGLVVYEEFLGASPRRKIRIGDRVSGSQGLVTIPEVSRMLLEASVSEAEVRSVHPGQQAVVRVEAYPDRTFAGTVSRVGTLAHQSSERPFDEKRFDLVVDIDSTDGDLRPEMTARADILVGTRENVLMAPINAIFDQGGTTVAHVRTAGGRVETRTVVLGVANDTFVEIISGVADGDRLHVTTPADAGRSTPAPQSTAPGAGGLVAGVPQPR